MCSIFGVLDIKSDPVELRKKALEMSRLMRHRGPDWSGIYATDRAILAHERLSIVDVNNGAQPLYNAAHTHILAVNGEIYNHQELRRQLKDKYEFQTDSDCEVILALYQEKGSTFLTSFRACLPLFFMTACTTATCSAAIISVLFLCTLVMTNTVTSMSPQK